MHAFPASTIACEVANFWAEAVTTACHIRNMVPSRGGSTPWEQFYGKKPDLSGLRVFGCLAYMPCRCRSSRRVKAAPDRYDPSAYACATYTIGLSDEPQSVSEVMTRQRTLGANYE
jgi:hypothetical protein